MFDAFKRSGKPGGNDWPRLVVLSIILSLRAYNADYDDDDDIYIYIYIYIYMTKLRFLTCMLVVALALLVNK